MAKIKKSEHWAELYRKALFEEDVDKLPSLLEQADQAVQQRLRELWCSPACGLSISDHERRQLDAAAYFLGLLRSLEARKAGGDSLTASISGTEELPGANHGSL
ncbi:MAG TPA: hypothetical protein VMG82_14425 [Candidatus Sulfotelmatobacter sp.]|nr:hypothetical protein [Candidatus Sulfotelmatobacter sp.]